MSWTERLIAPHRAVFELPAIAEGMGLHQARMYMEAIAPRTAKEESPRS
jgi:hypothetical protein